MVNCPKCGAEAEGKFCGQCGTKLPEVEEKQEKADSKKEEPKVKEITCPNCGNKVKDNTKFCDSCGIQLKKDVKTADVVAKPEKYYNPTTAVIASIIPGVGQVYNDQIKKGLTIFIIWLIGVILCLFLVGFIICAIMWIVAIYDAYTSANALNRGEVLEDKLF